MTAEGKAAVMEAIKFLGEQSVNMAKIASEMAETNFRKAIELRSEHMMDCAKMLKEWLRKS
jgi:hypothetical protein